MESRANEKRRTRRVTRRDLFHASEHAPPVEVELLAARNYRRHRRHRAIHVTAGGLRAAGLRLLCF